MITFSKSQPLHSKSQPLHSKSQPLHSKSQPYIQNHSPYIQKHRPSIKCTGPVFAWGLSVWRFAQRTRNSSDQLGGFSQGPFALPLLEPETSSKQARHSSWAKIATKLTKKTTQKITTGVFISHASFVHGSSAPIRSTKSPAREASFHGLQQKNSRKKSRARTGGLVGLKNPQTPPKSRR